MFKGTVFVISSGMPDLPRYPSKFVRVNSMNIVLFFFFYLKLVPFKMHGFSIIKGTTEYMYQRNQKLLKIRFVKKVWKISSLWHKLRFSNPFIFAAWISWPLIFQTINYASSNSPSLKYKRVTPSNFKDIGIRIFGFVANNQFLLLKLPLRLHLKIIKNTPVSVD